MKKQITVHNQIGENLLVKKDHSKYVRNAKFPCFAIDCSNNSVIYYNTNGMDIGGTLMFSILKSNNLVK